MKTIGLAALLLALAMPAWAANVEADDHERAIAVCIQVHTGAWGSGEWPNGSLCYMKHMPELKALEHAEQLLKACAANTRRPGCREELAYIKQRWGY